MSIKIAIKNLNVQNYTIDKLKDYLMCWENASHLHTCKNISGCYMLNGYIQTPSMNSGYKYSKENISLLKDIIFVMELMEELDKD